MGNEQGELNSVAHFDVCSTTRHVLRCGNPANERVHALVAKAGIDDDWTIHENADRLKDGDASNGQIDQGLCIGRVVGILGEI